MTDPVLPVSADIETATGQTFTFPVGSTYPPLRVGFTDAEDNPVPLGGIAGVSIRMTNADDEVVLDRGARIIEPSAGRVEYRWREQDTSEAGMYEVQFVVQRSDGRTMKLPSRYPIKVKIVA